MSMKVASPTTPAAVAIGTGGKGMSSVEEYAKIPQRLRKIAATIVGESRKELLAIAADLEQYPEQLFKPSYARYCKRFKARTAKKKLPPQPVGVGHGPEATNENRSNDERADESIQVVQEAVAILRRQYADWSNLSVRSRIKLLQTETLKSRGVKISSQTLYRPWVRGLW